MFEQQFKIYNRKLKTALVVGILAAVLYCIGTITDNDFCIIASMFCLLFFVLVPVIVMPEKLTFKSYFTRPESWLLKTDYEDDAAVVITKHGIFRKLGKNEETGTSLDLSLAYDMDNIEAAFKKDLAGAVLPALNIGQTIKNPALIPFRGGPVYMVYYEELRLILFHVEPASAKFTAQTVVSIPKKIKFGKAEYNALVKILKSENIVHSLTKEDIDKLKAAVARP